MPASSVFLVVASFLASALPSCCCSRRSPPPRHLCCDRRVQRAALRRVRRAEQQFDARSAYGGVFADAAAFNKQVRLFWLSAGTAETRFVQGMHHFADALAQIGVRCETYESSGTSHDWQTWRRSLHAFAPKLFRD